MRYIFIRLTFSHWHFVRGRFVRPRYKISSNGVIKFESLSYWFFGWSVSQLESVRGELSIHLYSGGETWKQYMDRMDKLLFHAFVIIFQLKQMRYNCINQSSKPARWLHRKYKNSRKRGNWRQLKRIVRLCGRFSYRIDSNRTEESAGSLTDTDRWKDDFLQLYVNGCGYINRTTCNVFRLKIAAKSKRNYKRVRRF